MAGIYIHIPFCKTRCIYCDFYSTTRSELKQQYIRALCTELKTRKGYLKEEPIETIYFGGGTPSQLAHEDFEQIFRTIKEVYGTEHAEEITLEANPDDLTAEYLDGLLEAGIEVGYSKEVRTGFKVGAKGGSYYISFSDDDFEALLKEYLRGKISELLFKA